MELGRNERVIRQFVYLMNQHCKVQHEVSFYANMLCMSSRHLTRILKKLTGSSAIQWITRAITTEARILLKNEELSIQHIAAELNFSDQASFSKFFKKQMGVSPLVYRRERRG